MHVILIHVQHLLPTVALMGRRLEIRREEYLRLGVTGKPEINTHMLVIRTQALRRLLFAHILDHQLQMERFA